MSSEELKTIIEAARVIAEHVNLESIINSVRVSFISPQIEIACSRKPDFIEEYEKEPYGDNGHEYYCKVVFKDYEITWFEDKENEDGSIKEDTGRA